MTGSVAVVGLGKLGLPMAACFAAKGFDVVGADLSSERVAAVNAGSCPIFEPGLDETMKLAARRLSATTSVADAVRGADAIFVVVPTPSTDNGSFSLEHVLAACQTIGPALSTDAFQLVVLTSTVSPGSTQTDVVPALETASGMRCGTEFGVCYSPEFIALGTVIRNFLEPDFVLVGESDERSGGLLEALYGRTCENDPPVVRTNFVNAEIAKLAVNTFVTTKISFGNMLAEVCERVPGGDVDAVTATLGLDRRIGARYLRGGLGYGGPCFPRDNRALARFARDIGVEPFIPEATDQTNVFHLEQVVRVVVGHLKREDTVAILGFAYKPGTDVVDMSQGILLGRALAKRGVAVVGFDPQAGAAAESALGSGVRVAGSLDDAVGEADVIVLATAWDEILLELPKALERTGDRKVIVDCWRALDPMRVREVAIYVPLGQQTPA